VYAFVEVADAAEEQPLATGPDTTLVWVHRDDDPAAQAEVLSRAVTAQRLPPGDGYCWVAAEAGAVKPIRRHLRQLGLPKEWVAVDGYWKRGVVNFDHHTVDPD
jgi:NADPH-dependent ferric siderophore reductase